MVNNKQIVKKSCKLCTALLIGVIAAYAVSKLLDKEKEKEKVNGVQPSCGCSA